MISEPFSFQIRRVLFACAPDRPEGLPQTVAEIVEDESEASAAMQVIVSSDPDRPRGDGNTRHDSAQLRMPLC